MQDITKLKTVVESLDTLIHIDVFGVIKYDYTLFGFLTKNGIILFKPYKKQAVIYNYHNPLLMQNIRSNLFWHKAHFVNLKIIICVYTLTLAGLIWAHIMALAILFSCVAGYMLVIAFTISMRAKCSRYNHKFLSDYISIGTDLI